MRIWIINALCVILLGGLIGGLVMVDPGYMMISYGSVTIESSLWVAIFALLVIVTLAVIVLRLTGVTFKSAGVLSAWSKRRRAESGREQTIQGLLAMAEGDWERARRVLAASAPRAESPLLNYLNAARAAHELGDVARRDEYLKRARESTPGSDLAVGITQAELELSQGQLQQCRATLAKLHEAAPRHRHVLEMLKTVYEALGDWEAIGALLPSLEKDRVFDAAELERLEFEVWMHEARRSAASADESADAALEEVWRRIPRRLRRNADWVLAFTRLAAGHEAGELAEKVVRESLSRDWSEELIAEYGRIAGTDAQQQLETAERWLKRRPNDAALLLALGRLAMRNHSWAKAREYFEASLERERTPEASAELGRLCTSLGDYESGAGHLEDALLRAPAALPELPLPKMGALHARGA